MPLIEQYSPYATVLTPAKLPELARTDNFRMAVSLTVPRGRAMAVKTADRLMYPFATGASDGTQLFVGFNKFSFKTDATGLAYLGDQSAVGSYRLSPSQNMPVYIRGVFDPQDLTTSATNTANVVTLTAAATIEADDRFIVTYTEPNLVAHTINVAAGGTTATTVATAVKAAWNADPFLSALAVATGTATVVLTAVIPGNDIYDSLTVSTLEADGSASDSQTWAKVETTAEVGRLLSVLQTSRPAMHEGADGYWYMLD